MKSHNFAEWTQPNYQWTPPPTWTAPRWARNRNTLAPFRSLILRSDLHGLSKQMSDLWLLHYGGNTGTAGLVGMSMRDRAQRRNKQEAYRRLDAMSRFPSRQAYRRAVLDWSRAQGAARYSGRTDRFPEIESALLARL